MNENIQNNIQEDEIDLRELFATIWRYKWFIFWMTFIITSIVVVVAYRMPKYYKTTIVIEVKPKADDKGGGFSLGGAGALLGLAGLGSASSSEAKDAAKMTLYRTNKSVIDQVRYSAQYFITKRFRPLELSEGNSSITITNLYIPDYRKFGMEVKFKPINKKKFALEAVSTLWNEDLGEFDYDKAIHTKYFAMTVHHNPSGNTPPETIVLNGDKHYIFDSIISKNLTAEVGSGEKKTEAELPFVTLSYLDTLPSRAEQYVDLLLKYYIHQSIGDELEDIAIQLGSINKQIAEIKEQAKSSGKEYERYKSKNTILAPEAQAEALIQQKALTDEKLSEIKGKLALANKLIIFAKNKKNIDSMAPSLALLGDEVTVGFIGKLQDLQAKEAELSQEFKAAYPKLRAIRRQITNLRSKISRSLIGLKKTLIDQQKFLQKENAKFTKELKHGPGLETGLASLTRDYKLYETMLTYLLQKRSSLELKKAEALNRFRIIDPIYTNPKPAKPKKALIAIVGLITALILSIFLVFFIEFIRGGKPKSIERQGA